MISDMITVNKIRLCMYFSTFRMLVDKNIRQ